MSALPEMDVIRETLSAHWDVSPKAVTAWPKSRRLFEIRGVGLARVNFAKAELDASQLTELLGRLGELGLAPRLQPNLSGDTSTGIQDVALSVEDVVAGRECDDARPDLLVRVGRGLGLVHRELYASSEKPGRVSSIDRWVDETLSKAETWASDWNLDGIIRDLRLQIGSDVDRLQARFGLTHGDVRGPNVLDDGTALRFIDFNCKYEPQVSDVVKMRNKWLMTDGVHDERPLTPEELGVVLAGYHETWPLTDADVESFPTVWAVEQAWRLSQDLRVTSRFAPERAARWPVRDQFEDLLNYSEVGVEIASVAGINRLM